MQKKNSQAQTVARDLKGLIASEVVTDAVIRSIYATDASIYRRMPLCVIRVKDLDDVPRVVAYCAEQGIPLAPRGGGTGLAGESLTRGVVLDFSTHCCGIDGIDNDAVWVDAGVVPTALNQVMKKEGLLFGPDPATSDRCSIGGMIGINSTGSHSLVYGYTDDKVQALDVVLGDGTRLLLEKTAVSDLERREGPTGLLGRLKRITEKAAQVPLPFHENLKRNRHGYRIWDALDGDGLFDPTRFVAGSEGTLAVVLRAKLTLDPVPPAKGLVVLKCSDRTAPLEWVPEILGYKPAALEFMDEVLLDLARTFPAYRSLFAQQEAAWLLVTFEGAQDRVREGMASLQDAFQGRPGLVGVEATEAPARQAFLVGVREAAVPLLYRRTDGFLPLPFLEDAAVPPERLAAYVRMLRQTFESHGLSYTAYGHAGPGELHVRPFLKPWESDTQDLLPALAETIFERVQDFGGSVSGEHGDGILRSFYIRKQYGDDLWRLFRQVKAAFDPAGILNPGKKVVEDEALPLEGLRYPGGSGTFGLVVPAEELALEQDELARVAVGCTGCGSCRSMKPSMRMCPVFRVLNTEEASPRAKNNLLREIADGTLDLSDGINQVLDLCLWCRSCGRECPSGLSIPEGIIELRGRKQKRSGLTWEKRIMSGITKAAQWGAWLPGLYNFFLRRKWVRAMSQYLAGIDARMPAPALARRRLVRKGLTAVPEVPAGKTPVAFFADLYSDYFAPELGRRIIALLESAGCFVVVPRQEPCGVVPLVYGKVDAARRIARRNAASLAPFAAAGFAVVCGEPTAALMLKKDYPLLLPKAGDVADRVMPLGAFLYQRWQQGQFTPLLNRPEEASDGGTGEARPLTGGAFAYHKPCHLYELDECGPGFVPLLKEALGLSLASLPERCCGLAGTFGMRSAYSGMGKEIGEPIFEAIRRGGYQGVVSECASCRMQLEAQGGLKSIHPAAFFRLP